MEKKSKEVIKWQVLHNWKKELGKIKKISGN